MLTITIVILIGASFFGENFFSGANKSDNRHDPWWEADFSGKDWAYGSDGVPVTTVVRGDQEKVVKFRVISHNGWEGKINYVGSVANNFAIEMNPSHLYLNKNAKMDVYFRVQAGAVPVVASTFKIVGDSGEPYQVKFNFVDGSQSLPKEEMQF